MHTNFTRLFGVCVLMTFCSSLFGQFQFPYVEDYGVPSEVQLGAPNPNEGTMIFPVGTDLYNGNNVNTIFYGLNPSGSKSKPVLVFVHGYSSSANVWFEGDDNMYHDAYQSGYRTAFVSLAPNKHMWTNGNMLSRMIDVVSQHYGVNKVNVVAWSKGGVDTDAALVHFGANNKVAEVFTLSTPHNGTSIAEVANSVLLSLVNVIFMQNNDGTRSLTRGYMSYFRSITDGQSANNTPYTTLGGWGNGPLNRLAIPQGIMWGIDGARADGGNDGVVPYQSSLRPGGRELFDGQRKAYGWFGIPYYPGASQTELDHFEVTRGIVWPYVNGVFSGTLRMSPNTTPSDHNPNRTVASQMQLVASAGGANTFSLSTDDVAIQVLAGDEFSLIHTASGTIAELEDLGEGNFRVINPMPGTYTVSAEGEFAGMVVEPEGAKVSLEMEYGENGCLFEADDPVMFRVLAEGGDLNGAEVNGTMHRLHDLQFQEVEGEIIPLRFEGESGVFRANAGTAIAEGVYSITVNVSHGDLSRTLTATFSKLGRENEVPAPEMSIAMTAFPNPFVDRLTVQVESASATTLRIYDIFGRQLESVALGQNATEYIWNAKSNGYTSGMYIIELENISGEKVSRKVILE